MIEVPRITTPSVQQSGLSNARQQIDTPDMMFGDGGKALMQGADALDKLGADLNKRALDEAGERNAARALELEGMARREVNDVIYNPETGLLTRKGGLALGVSKELQTKMAEIRKKYGSMDGDPPDVKTMVNKSLASLEQSSLDLTDRHQFTELQSYKSEQLNSQATLAVENVAHNFTDETVFKEEWDKSAKTLAAKAAQEGWSPEKFREERQNQYSTMRSAQITAMISQDKPDYIIKAKEVYDEAQSRGMLTFKDSETLDKLFDAALPQAAAQKAYGGLGITARSDEADIINYVIDKFEGGDKLAQEPKGGVAKFGINSNANPDIDVKNLTREQAVKLYKERYWNKIGADQLPESVRFVAYDTAVNMGVETAKKLIEQSGGDPNKLIELRYQAYVKLAKDNPAEYAKFLPAWKSRLAELKGQLVSNPDQETVTAAASKLDLEYPGAGAELLELHKKTLGAREAAQKAQQTEFLDRIMPGLYQNNGDWSAISATDKAKAIELGVWDDVTKFKGVSNPALNTRLAQMDTEEIMSTDFSDPRWRLNLSQTDYDGIVQKQTNLRDKPSARGEFRTTRDIVSKGWQSIGKKTSDLDYGTFQAAAEDAFQAEIEARGGKPLSADDKKVIVSKMVLNTSVGSGWFDGDQKRVYQLDPDTDFQVDGAPAGVVDGAVRALVMNNLEPSQDNVEKFIENPSQFIQVPGYSETDIGSAVQSLMRAQAQVNPASVKSYLEKKSRSAAK